MEKETYWSKFADDFEELNNYVVGKSDMNIILKEVSQLKDLKNTLELGCGNGTYSKVLANNADKLLATDLSDKMLNIAKYRLKVYPNVNVERANCFALPYAANSFDTVFMANLLHIVYEPEKVILESKRVLKNDGRIIVLDLGMEGITLFNKIGMMYRYLKTYGKPSATASNLTLQQIQFMLERNSFNVIEAKLIGDKIKAIFITAIFS